MCFPDSSSIIDIHYKDGKIREGFKELRDTSESSSIELSIHTYPIHKRVFLTLKGKNDELQCGSMKRIPPRGTP